MACSGITLPFYMLKYSLDIHHVVVVYAARKRALMMKAASTAETSVNFYQTTRRYNPEDSRLQCLKYLLNFNIYQNYTGISQND
jgi:hypothetical protein